MYWILFFLSPAMLWAHPHTFMDMGITAVTDENSVIGFEIEWLFDFVFSVDTIRDCDWNEDGEFDSEEMEYLEYAAFNNLENYHYFTWIRYNGEEILPKTYQNFYADFEEDELTYHFFIPFKAPFSEIKQLEILIYDDTFFCDIAFFKKRPYAIRGKGSDKIEALFTKDKTVTVNYDKTVVSSQREGATYTGKFTPFKVVLKPKR